MIQFYCQILDVSCYIQKLLRKGILVQSHFNLSMSATQAQHLSGTCSIIQLLHFESKLLVVQQDSGMKSLAI
ncbi:hypothetical protein CMV_025958 [Castanea mollissima]|uniref:Uncharacterized protein n=1 Tax=Castanea mollissima TaxID=60419 RepID=A0A8J4QCJ4_9ROSI|nr:hypothetical protein CMV_025958 [Castanea mollissima]